MKRPLVLSLVTLAVLAAMPAAPASAAFPGRNARLAFQHWDALNNLGEIHTITATGGGDLDLTATPLIEDRDPAWSADGTRIAFRRAGAGVDQLWVMDGAGGALAVVPGSGTASSPAFSPGGKRLVYECWVPFTTETDLCLRNVDGSNFTLLTATAGISERDPVWSPDGTRIVYSRELPAGAGSFLVSIELKTLSSTAITPPVAGTYDGWPDWSPDSGQIVFSRFVSGSGSGGAIRTMKATGGKSALVTAPVPGSDSHHTMPVWSPDGKKIAYVHLDDDESWGYIYTIAPDGTGNTQITFGPGTDEVPDWRAG
jgi:Tol biopolymer transport system component